MRLLVHGGTSYSERHRIGEWPAIDRDALESTLGLAGDNLIFGVGVLDKCSPFFIVRSRSVTDIGRSYALSILIDPGRQTWQRFDWNAAEIIQAFLRDELSDLLRTEPESLSVEGLQQAIDRLPPLAPDQSSSDGGKAPATPLVEGWLGAAFSDEPVVLNPASLGLNGRPSCEDLAVKLTRINEPCFRIGAGWLVGASPQHARALGARLVIDETGSNEKDETDTHNRGKDAVDAWLRVRANKEFHQLVLKLEAIPICEWENANGVSGGDLLQRLKLVSQIVSNELPAQLIETFEPQLGKVPFLSAETRSLVHELLLSSRRRLSGAETALVLRNYFTHGLPIANASATEDMDQDTLVRMVVEHEASNPNAVKDLTLPREITIDAYVRKLGKVPQFSQVPGLLKEASEFVSAEGPNGTRKQADQQKLVDAAGGRIRRATESLHVWDTFPREHLLWVDLAGHLQEAAQRRAAIRAAGWELEYLCFGSDLGGKRLVTITDNKSAYSELVNRYLKEIQEQGDLSQQARQWLEALAGSPLRPSLGIKEKVAIAQTSGMKSWEALLFLWSAFNSDPPPIRTVVPGPRDPERVVLRDELIQMLEAFPPRTKFPDLPRIKKSLHLIPSEFLRTIMSDSRRQFNSSSFAMWIKGLRDASEPEFAAEEIVTFCLNSRSHLPQGWLFHGFDANNLYALAEKLLFEGISTEDEFYNRRCREVLADTTNRSRLCEAFRSACSKNFPQEQRVENFMRRFSKDKETLARLFVCMSEHQKQHVLKQISGGDRDQLIELASRILDDLDAGVGLTAYTYFVLKSVGNWDAEVSNLSRWRGLKRQPLDVAIKEAMSTYNDQIDRCDTSEGLLDESKINAATTGFPQQNKEKTSRDTSVFHRFRSFVKSLIYDEPLPAEESKERFSQDEKDNSS